MKKRYEKRREGWRVEGRELSYYWKKAGKDRKEGEKGRKKREQEEANDVMYMEKGEWERNKKDEGGRESRDDKGGKI